MDNRPEKVRVLHRGPQEARHNVYNAASRSVELCSLPPTLTASHVHTGVVRDDIAVPGNRCFELRNLLAIEECKYLIARCEETGFEEHSDVAAEYPVDYRNNQRLIVINDDLAGAIWKRLWPHLRSEDIAGVTPLGWATEGTWLPTRLNKCFLFSRYKEGQFFKPHYDGMYKDTTDECSIFTLTLYLNDDFTGGNLTFRASPEDLTRTAQYQPLAGSGVIFNHDTYHEGEQVTMGTKYIARTSIMFARVEDLSDPNRGWEKDPEWLHMREVFNSFDKLAAKGDPNLFTSRFLEVQKIQIKHSHTLHHYDPLPLPDDIVHLIMCQVPLSTIGAVMQASKSWKICVRNGRLWRQLFAREFGEMSVKVIEKDPKFNHPDAGVCDWATAFRLRRAIHKKSEHQVAFPSFYFYTSFKGQQSVQPGFLELTYDPWDSSFETYSISYDGEPWYEKSAKGGSFLDLPGCSELILSSMLGILLEECTDHVSCVIVTHPGLWSSATNPEHNCGSGKYSSASEANMKQCTMHVRGQGYDAIYYLDSTLAALLSKGFRSGIVAQQAYHRLPNKQSPKTNSIVVIQAFKDMKCEKHIELVDATPNAVLSTIAQLHQEAGLADVLLVEAEVHPEDVVEHLKEYFDLAIESLPDMFDQKFMDTLRSENASLRVGIATADNILEGATTFTALPECDVSDSYDPPPFLLATEDLIKST